MNHNIYCLQDTHFTLETENDIRTLWGYDCFFSSYSSNSRGVAILFKNNFEFSVSKVKGDSDGNYIILEFTTEGKSYFYVAFTDQIMMIRHFIQIYKNIYLTLNVRMS